MTNSVFFHITDIHFNSVYDSAFMRRLTDVTGLDLTRQLRLGLEHMAGLCARPDFILISGDLVHEGNAAEYRELRGIIAARFPGVPLFAAPGNHDSLHFSSGGPGTGGAAYFEAALPCGARLVCLDSRGGEYGSGRLDGKQLEWLESTLAASPEAPRLLMLHHTPHISGERDFLTWQMENPRALAYVARGANLLGIFTGHTHMRYESDFIGIPCHTAPSITYEIDAGFDRFLLSNRTGYNLCEYSNGKLTVTPVEIPPEREIVVEVPYSQL